MPDLVRSLQGRDLGYLKIVAGLWGVELSAPDARAGLPRLAQALLDRAKVEELVDSLETEARLALEDLIQNEGRLPWPLFTRRYGAVRVMGPGRRDRERPYLSPASPAEVLWYRALIARSFFDTPTGPEEFAYIPDDLLELIPWVQRGLNPPLGRPASPAERLFPRPAHDHLLDHACTLLAALRLGFKAEKIAGIASGWKDYPLPPSSQALQKLLFAAGLLDSSGMPLPEPVRAFLEAERGEALARLARTWLTSSEFNELRLVPSFKAEGDWQNDPLLARQALLDFLATVPGRDGGEERPYWSLVAFLEAVRQRYPDFQRPAGDYDSWFLRDVVSGEFLRGFEHWNEVDGTLITYLITGPLHWLGILDLACQASSEPDSPGPVASFRYSDWAASLLHGQPPSGLPLEEAPIRVRSDARLVVPRLSPRAVRYQIARFCVWEKETEDEYTYRLTPASLARARQQGLTTNHLLALLRRHAGTVAPSLVKALERWERQGVEARLEKVTVLRLSSPELLQALRSSRAARFLGDPLGPTVVIVKPGAAEKVFAILAEMGYLGQGEVEGEE